MTIINLEIRITDNAFDPEKEMRSFRKSHSKDGAIASFLGQVRDENGGVQKLHLEHYPGYSEKRIAEKLTFTMERWELTGVKVIHRIGELLPGAPIVLVATASAHRRPAFEAADFIMDYLKSEAPLWKQETTSIGAQWIEPRQEDLSDIKRWRTTA